LPQCPDGVEQIWQDDHVKQFIREAVVTNIPTQNKAGELPEVVSKYAPHPQTPHTTRAAFA
jgi:hypothetical protein